MLVESWQISEFAEKVGKHFTTTDSWFKKLEERRIHYINRVESGEKIYNQDDLKIGLFIKEYRDKKYTIDSIFDLLQHQEEINLRPFPEDFDSKDTKITDEAQINKLKTEIIASMKEVVATQIEEERKNRVNDLILQRKIVSVLEGEASKEWSKLPESERMMKVGLFRKGENTEKRNEFIKKYVDERYEERIKDTIIDIKRIEG
ncbi:hypothetical protein [Chengkuizengella marina]|uniref:MerR family transcriptional regulator n=1 Tax=Chengkuizengella marina TaxID=2507566 RepID=A0A6N9Q295_9BACL|nr:hypothetical protein [Chengkuizengella marina]NBI28624.1 hypothetical protein [Chengkuizengella marina]